MAGTIAVVRESDPFFEPGEDDCEECGHPAVAMLCIQVPGEFWNKVYCELHLDHTLTAILGDGGPR